MSACLIVILDIYVPIHSLVTRKRRSWVSCLLSNGFGRRRKSSSSDVEQKRVDVTGRNPQSSFPPISRMCQKRERFHDECEGHCRKQWYHDAGAWTKGCHFYLLPLVNQKAGWHSSKWVPSPDWSTHFGCSLYICQHPSAMGYLLLRHFSSFLPFPFSYIT